jgi:hypothetical protein
LRASCGAATQGRFPRRQHASGRRRDSICRAATAPER